MEPRVPSWAYAAATTVLLLTPTLTAFAEQDLSDLHKTPLTSVSGVTDIDAPPDPEDPGAGGGIDTTTYFRNRLLPKLEDCTSQIETVITTWAKAHQLTTPKTEKLPGNLLIHATRGGLDGIFEVTYRVDQKRERARATVFFYSRDGERHEPAGIQRLLNDFKIAEIQDQLEKALRCGVQ